MELFNTYPFLDARIASHERNPSLGVLYGPGDLNGKIVLVVRVFSEDSSFELIYTDEDMATLRYEDYLEEIQEIGDYLLEVERGNSYGSV